MTIDIRPPAPPVPVSKPARPPGLARTMLRTVTGWRQAGQDRRTDQLIVTRELAVTRALVHNYRARWRQACERLGFGQMITTGAGTWTGRLPLVQDVDLGQHPDDNVRLLVEMCPGQTVDLFTDYGPELAAALGTYRLRFTQPDVRHPSLLVELIESDPLAEVIPFLPPAPPGHVVVGVDEWGEIVSTDLPDLTHMILAGATRSGKSWQAYSLLAQLAQRARDHGDVVVVGIDPTALLLGPWGEHEWRACGTHGDPAARYEAAIAGVVAEMDGRVAALSGMRPRVDKLDPSPELPMIVVVVEEAGAVAKLTGHTSTKPSPVHKGLSRLLAEGAKAGIRVLTIVQRAEAAVIGSFERDQSLTRMTFAVNDPNSLNMLHQGVTEDVAASHGAAPKGVALLTAPGIPLARFRAPAIGSYGRYCAEVESS